ncbi:putative coiled-coil domain-containing protein 144C [Meleagris gallopavo]|uniref:putative coiled-coil domain-containing protein 144C n=1 Tax=Meleagris gallopavo TaxID=9103 RepID=UPI0012AC568E|nr:putative coiled-coil domain-containing protein 144C [Meleagris gallopavo]
MEKIRKFFGRLRKTRRRCSVCVHPTDCTEQESQGEGPLEYEVKQAEGSADGVAEAKSAPLHLSNTDGVAAATSAPLSLSNIDGVAVQTSALLGLTEAFESQSSSANNKKQGFKRELEPSCVESLPGKIPELKKSNKTLPQQQKKSHRRAHRRKRQLEQWEGMLKEKTLLLEATEKALFQAQRQAKECCASYLAKGEPRKETAEWEVLQEQVAQLQRENLSLRQQLEDVQKTNERKVRQLQQELAEAVGKQQITEASLKTSAELSDSLKKENSKLQEDLHKANAKVRDLYAQLELEHSKLLQQKRTNEELRVKEAVLKQRLEAVAEDYKISAWIEKKRKEKMQEKLANSFRKQSASETSLKRSEDYCRYLENDILMLKESLDKANIKVFELTVQLEVERETSLQLEMKNRALQDLVHQHRPQATAAGCSPFSQNGRWHEESAPEEMGPKREPSLFFW